MRVLPCIAMLALTGCASAPVMPKPEVITKTIYIPWQWPGALQDCPADPAPVAKPHIPLGDPHSASTIALYITRRDAYIAALQSVADDCRAVLQAAIAANRGAQ